MQHFSKGGVLQFRDTQGFKMKEKKKGRGETKMKRGDFICTFWKHNKDIHFFFIEVEECSSSQEQNGHTSLQNWTTLLFQATRSYVNREMLWWSPEPPLCEVPTPGLGSTSHAENTCISGVEQNHQCVYQLF